MGSQIDSRECQCRQYIDDGVSIPCLPLNWAVATNGPILMDFTGLKTLPARGIMHRLRTSKSFWPQITVLMVVFTCPCQNHLCHGHLKCRTIMAKRTPAWAFNSLHLRAGDVERNPGQMQPCYICGGTTITKELECVKCCT